MHEITLLPGAFDDVENAMAWYCQERDSLALEFEAELDAALERIRRSPQMSPVYDAKHRFHLLRRFPYTVIFELEGDRVVVVAIAHAKRRPDYWRTR